VRVRFIAPAVIFIAACGGGAPSKSEAASALGSGKLISGSPDKNLIALTFDDGPKPGAVEDLLLELEKQGIKATFFVVGKMVVEHPDLLKSIIAKGHLIANHSYSHPNLKTLKPEQVLKELTDTNEAISRVTGKPVRYFRPPGGNYDAMVMEQIRKAGLINVLWTINTADYTGKKADAIAAQVIDGAKPGGIVLAHTGAPETVAALPRIARELRAKGFEFVTVDEIEKSLGK
jgi:peptidoglycan/xylan/chitin deacetylase (PgdA/CDA1 family)